MYDPFNGIKPSLGPFQAVLGTKIGVIIALVWACAFVYCAIHLIQAVAGVAAARRQHRVDANEKAWACAAPGIAIIVLAVIPAVYAALAQ